MSIVEDVRKVLQDFLAPELREIRGEISGIGKRLDALEQISQVRYDSVIQRLEQIQQSFAFDKRLSDLEADRKKSA